MPACTRFISAHMAAASSTVTFWGEWFRAVHPWRRPNLRCQAVAPAVPGGGPGGARRWPRRCRGRLTENRYSSRHGTVLDTTAAWTGALVPTVPASAALVKHTPPWLHAEYNTPNTITPLLHCVPTGLPPASLCACHDGHNGAALPLCGLS